MFIVPSPIEGTIEILSRVPMAILQAATASPGARVTDAQAVRLITGWFWGLDLLGPLTATTSEAHRLVSAITCRHPLIRTLPYDDTRYHGDEIVETAASASASTFRISRRPHSPARWSSSSAGTPIGAAFDSW